MNKNLLNSKAIVYLPLLVLLSLLTTPAMGQMNENYRPFQSWDADNNEKLSSDEYLKGVVETNVFDAWDDDDNGSLSKGELHSGIYKKWERSGENFKTRAEARSRAWARYYSGTFDDWDLDGDGTITNAEYNEKIGKGAPINFEKKMDINQDGRIEQKEFYATLFILWDEDGNGFLNMKEYNPDEFESWFL